MLTELYIENVAVVEKTKINFKSGLNILTGETGAGKSIVIDSINAILGGRVSKDIIRTGANSAFVSAIFSNIPDSIKKFIINMGFNLEEDNLILQREININGKSTARINDRPTTVSILKSIGTKLINIHGQHENYDLFSSDIHMKYIDKLGNLDMLLNEYKKYFFELKSIKKRLDELATDESEKARKLDLLNYQINEIEEANLKENEKEDLLKQQDFYINKEKISNSILNARYAINGDENEKGALSLLEIAGRELDAISEIYPDIYEISNKIQNMVFELKDYSIEMGNFSNEAEIEKLGIEAVEERLNLISDLSRKYGSTIKNILDYLEKAKQELKEIELSDDEINKLNKKFEVIKEKTKYLAFEISKKRLSISNNFKKRVKEELKFLDMDKVNLEVKQERCKLNEFGCDTIEFLISTNPGELPKPVSKIASGGELSRLMLAIKNVLAKKDDINTMIFDEIDTGISGSAAQKVGLKLKDLSRDKQVICVTHLAQIASLADEHFLIKKDVKDNRTFTNVQNLNFEERKKELARIIGGVTITELTLKNAEEMLKSNR